MLSVSPVAADDTLLISQDVTTPLDSILLNDSDADGDALSIASLASFSTPSHGSIIDNGGGSYAYVPDVGYAGADRFQYQVDDNVDGSDTAWVDISVNQPIDAAAARAQILSGVTTLINPGGPGRIAAFGPTAYAIGNDSGGGTIIAAAGWGQGRVIAMNDHQWLDMSREIGSGTDTGQYYENSIAWLAGTTDKSIKIVTYSTQDNTAWLTSHGYTNVVKATSSTLASKLNGAAAFVPGWLGSNVSTSVIDTVSDYVRGGGGLFVSDYGTGYSWWWGKPTYDAPGNVLLREAGIGFPNDTSAGLDVSSATGHINADVVLDMLDDSSGYTQAELDEGGRLLDFMFEVLPPGDSLLAQLDAKFWNRIDSINPTPSTPVSDPFDIALLNREAQILRDLPATEVTAHRTAEAVYGAIPADAPRVTRQVTLDTTRGRWHATGLYAAPGELVTVTVPSSLVNAGYKIRVNAHKDWVGRSTLERLPYVHRSYDINSTTVQVANAFGGSIFIDFGGNAYSTPPNLGDVGITIAGAVEQPYFVLGENTDQEWNDTLRDLPAPYAVFVSDNLVFTQRSSESASLTEPTALMTWWNQVIVDQDSLANRLETRTSAEMINVDVQQSAGAAHSGYPVQAYDKHWGNLANYDNLRTSGSWGDFHELGHNHQRGWWTFSGDGEVTVNVFSNNNKETLASEPTTAGWGWSADPVQVINRAIGDVSGGGTYSSKSNRWSFWFQLADGFGWDAYRNVFGTYELDNQNNPSNLPSNDAEEKNEFFSRWSNEVGYDMTQFMVDTWGLSVSQSVIDSVSGLPDWMPLATTAVGFQVDPGNSHGVDLANGGIGMDGVATFVGVTTAPHEGDLNDNGDGTYTYVPQISGGTDSFVVRYQSSAGNTQDFTIEVTIGNGYLAGDVNLDGVLDMADVNQFIEGWRSDTTELVETDKIRQGDLNLDGTTDFNDFFILHEAWNDGTGVSLELASLLSGDAGTASGLIHHWNLDEGPDWHDDPFQSVATATVARDLVGGADAALTNMDAQDWVSGRQFTALDFDGENDHLAISGDLSATLGGSSSLSFWVRTTQVGGSAGSNSPGVMGTDLAGNDIQWGWIDASGRMNLSSGDTVIASTAQPINDGLWHHIVLTRDATTGDGQVYVDGQLSDSRTGPVGPVSSSFSSIGRIEDGAGTPGYFAGRLDQIHIYDHVIDAAKVEVLKDNHAPKTYEGDSNIISSAVGTNAAPFSTHSATMGFAFDAERDAMSIASFDQPDHGVVTDNGDGSFTYTANSGFVGNDSFRVVVTDGNDGYSETTLSVVVLDGAASATSATTAFTDFQVVQAGGTDIAMSGWSVPRAIDWNADGKQDILVGGNGSVWRYINIGTATEPVFSAGVKVQASGTDINLGSTSITITLSDMTGDGVDDLVAVDSGKKVRVFRNTSAAGQTPVYVAATFVQTPDGSDLVLQDQRFDLGDYNNDGLVDLVQGTRSSGIWVYDNVGSASDPRFDTSTQLFGGAYNLYPRVTDLNFDGQPDLLRGINWGDVKYWMNAGGQDILDGAASSKLSITDAAGVAVNVKSMTDGAIVDLADYNGDGIPDLLLGSHASAGDQEVFIAYGKDASANIDAIDAIYDANLPNLGDALSANDDALLGEVNSLNSEFINWAVTLANPVDRRAAFDRLVQHINKYPQFLKHQILDTNVYHHLPSIAGQNWMTLHQLGPNTEAHLTEVADAMGLTGGHRDIYLENGLVIGDGANASVGQLLSIQTFMQTQPGVLFPDGQITIDRYWGDGRGGIVNVFTSAKNVFAWEVGGNGSSEWAADLKAAITSTIRTDTRADGFTYVVGHEVTHSLDGYTRSRANEDLERRWGQTMVLAGGPDIIAGDNGWYSKSLTKTHWQNTGLWDGDSNSWDAAWTAYWTTGPGSVWEDTSFMRGNIDWFFGAPQESLATQGNQYWADGEGRLVGAVDRFNRGVEQGIDPLKANITEVVHFIDLQSAGMNKINLFDIDTQSNPRRAVWNISEAYLDRNELGYITQVTVDDRYYKFTVDANGIVTDVVSNVFFLEGDVNFDGVVDGADVDQFVEGWRSDTSGLTDMEMIMKGDLNQDGTTNFSDWFIMRRAYNEHNSVSVDLVSLLAARQSDVSDSGSGSVASPANPVSTPVESELASTPRSPLSGLIQEGEITPAASDVAILSSTLRDYVARRSQTMGPHRPSLVHQGAEADRMIEATVDRVFDTSPTVSHQERREVQRARQPVPRAFESSPHATTWDRALRDVVQQEYRRLP